MKIKMIFACTENDYVFGNANKLPWAHNVKRDMDIFREYTKDCILVMGRKTFESLPGKLRNLPHVVISGNSTNEQITNQKGQNPCITLKDIDDALSFIVSSNSKNNDCCFIGGAGVLEEIVEFVDDCIISEFIFRDECKRYYDAPRYINLPHIIKTLNDRKDHLTVCIDKLHEIDDTESEIYGVSFTQYTKSPLSIII